MVPAPKRAKKVKGVKSAEELFAVTLTDAINEVARQGWEYVRAEHMPAEASRGWFRSALQGEQTVLVFRRQREGLGPRLATVRSDVRPDPHTDAAPDAHLSDLPAAAPRSRGDPRRARGHRPHAPARALGPARAGARRRGDAADPAPALPRLGPADKA